MKDWIIKNKVVISKVLDKTEGFAIGLMVAGTIMLIQQCIENSKEEA